jgi:hypothetical protein
MHTLKFPVLALAAALAASCSTDVQGPWTADAAINARIDGAPPADASTQNTHVVLTPEHNFISVGDEHALSAVLRDENDNTVTTSAETMWSSANEAVATVSGGTVTGVAAGTVDITATIDGKSATVRIDVYGDLSACCAVANSQAVDNYCNVAPSTAECPMTAPGGACDVDADGDYDELVEDGWIAMNLYFAATCTPDTCSEDSRPQVANIATDCSADYNPAKRKWRCVELTTDFPGVLASQVCQDLNDGSGPRWYTYNLTPTDCCACEGQNVDVGTGIPAACICTGPDCIL